jgi:hypothetical protein
MTNNESGAQPENKAKKERSPSFPFIGLTKALQRAGQVYEKARRHEARVSDIADAWGWGAKSSGTQQTIAALLSYGLLEDQGGSGEARKLKITDLAFKALEDQRPGVKEAALAEAATKPKLIAEYLEKWKDGRPADGICISELRIDRGFTEDGASQFLKVFDDTSGFTIARPHDKLPENATANTGQTGESGDKRVRRDPSPRRDPPPGDNQRKVTLMDGERVVFTEESDPQNYLKLIASGDVDETMLEALEDYVKRQKKRLVNAYRAGMAQMAASGHKPPPTLLGGVGEQGEWETTSHDSKAAQIPFMITNAQKMQLREMGYNDDAISSMTPIQVQEAIAGRPWTAK